MIEAYCTSAKTRQTLNSSKSRTRACSPPISFPLVWDIPHSYLLFFVQHRNKLKPVDLNKIILGSLITVSSLFFPHHTWCSFIYHDPLLPIFWFWHLHTSFFIESFIYKTNLLSWGIIGSPIFVVPQPTSILSICNSPSVPSFIWFDPALIIRERMASSAWQGTDLMHNHVLDQSSVDSLGRRSSISRPEATSDLSEDSDYDSIWTAHSYRMGSVSRKSSYISHQN